MPIPMELSRIIISEINDQQVIYLKETGGDRTFPILIGIFEATSIDRRVKGFPSPRPLTHDLIVKVVQDLGAEFQDVVISELKEHTYYAKLRVRQEGELVEIDALQVGVRKRELGGLVSGLQHVGIAPVVIVILSLAKFRIGVAIRQPWGASEIAAGRFGPGAGFFRHRHGYGSRMQSARRLASVGE